jgi:tRNA pseudouridine55 synthase
MCSAGKKSPNGSETLFGFINVLKPSGMTSHDVVSRIRRLAGVKQVGHAGTLDRLATGVLPVAVGKACRLIRYLRSDKIYYAEILLGQRTTTDDIEGEVIPAGLDRYSSEAQARPEDVPEWSVDSHGETMPMVSECLKQTGTKCSALPAQEQIRALLAGFEGEQDQLPPAYSAIHHQGKRLYQLALADQTPQDLKPRRVAINRIELLRVEDSELIIRVWCGGGTYIRALARDIGEKLGCGACIKALRRESSGPFEISQACSLSDLEELAGQGKLSKVITEPAFSLDLPSLNIDQNQFSRIKRGQSIVSTFPTAQRNVANDHIVLLYRDKVVAICRPGPDNKLRPEVVLADAESSL